MAKYNIGDAVKLTANFTNQNSALADPTTVNLKIKRPDGTLDTYSTTGSSLVPGKTADGIFSHVYYLASRSPGRYYYRFVSICG